MTRLGTVSAARSTPIAPAMLRELRRSSADLIVLHEPNPWGLLSCAIARPAAPLVVYFHSEVVRPALQYALFYHPVARAVYSRAARIIVASPPMAEHARALQPYRDRISVIPYGTDPEAWVLTPAVQSRATEIRAAQSAGGRWCCSRVALSRYKGCEVLLRALKGIGRRRCDSSATARCGRSAWRRRRRWGFAIACSSPAKCRRQNCCALYRAADLFVLPSVTRAEAFGFVQVEAMACGTPVISTNVKSGVPWVNQHGVTGVVVEPGDVEALRRALSTLLADRVPLDAMGVAGRQRVEQEFTLATMGDRAASLFEELAAVIKRLFDVALPARAWSPRRRCGCCSPSRSSWRTVGRSSTRRTASVKAAADFAP